MRDEDPIISVPDSPNPQPLLLVVDDDPEIRGSIAALFTSLGYEVATAKDGTEALDHMARRRADVVLTDIYMQGVDGFELINALRKSYRTTMVAAMSGGHVGFNPLVFANKLGADLVIAKPFRCSQLVEAIDRLIHSYRRLPA
jgi:CheY-like chemotaxis protein